MTRSILGATTLFEAGVPPKEVVPQEALRAFAAGTSEGTRSVLIEPRSTEKYTVRRKRSVRREGWGIGLSVSRLSDRRRKEIEESLAKVLDALETFGVERSVPLRASQVVVANLTSEQMRKVAAHPGVRRILLNEQSSR